MAPPLALPLTWVEQGLSESHLVETMSLVEQTLREDPEGSYARMDFATRDRYRDVVEQLAKDSPLSEVEVARRAIQLAHEGAARNDADPREAHLGFYLIDSGRPLLETAVDAKRSGAAVVASLESRFPAYVYLGAILTLSAILSAGMISMARADALSSAMLGVVIGSPMNRSGATFQDMQSLINRMMTSNCALR